MDFTRQAKYWVDPAGQFHLVSLVDEGDQLCHEEWAEQYHESLENLLEQGWVRIQHIYPLYTYIDYHHISLAQIDALRLLLHTPSATTVIEVEGKAETFALAANAEAFLEQRERNHATRGS
ncbi:MAG: hypothetical protein U0792_05525 [Gemmataceae bacterium]